MCQEFAVVQMVIVDQMVVLVLTLLKYTDTFSRLK